MQWKEIENTLGNYLVSSMGEVKSIDRVKNNNGGSVQHIGKILKQQTTKKGYKSIRITVNKISYNLSVHRLVAKAFIENPYNKPQVNHLNSNKSDNRVENLEWCSNRENSHHRALFNDKKSSKFIGVHWVDKDEIWNCQIRIQRKTYTIGRFKQEIDASVAYEKALKDWNEKSITPKTRQNYPNVSFNKKRQKWFCYIIKNKKVVPIGYFKTESEAIIERKKYD